MFGNGHHTKLRNSSKLSTPYEKSAAVVVLPAVGGGRLEDPLLRRWLSRSDLIKAAEPEELLGSILARLKLPYSAEGLGALRMWGQTGDRPAVWIAAADPVYLEPRLDHLCLHAIGGDTMPTSDLRPLFDHLQRTLQDDSRFGFARVGSYGYLRASEAIATSDVPSYVAHLDKPNDYMPGGHESGTYRNLISEVEMSLHDHEINLRRQNEGLQPVNCLWFWGGGYAPEQCTVPHPPLFSNNPLLKGYWLSKTGVVEAWPGTVADCLDKSVAGFVAVLPAESDSTLLHSCLHELRDALLGDRLSGLKLIFRDGISVHVRPNDNWRFWRPVSTLLS